VLVPAAMHANLLTDGGDSIFLCCAVIRRKYVILSLVHA